MSTKVAAKLRRETGSLDGDSIREIHASAPANPRSMAAFPPNRLAGRVTTYLIE